ncbi:MAG: hypothetical protein M3N13_04725 [Candidatus Eremiobacteraeota bacterium]|nr:hypothetical protein [Candidatus Eremiobacteraeota bacterium]
MIAVINFFRDSLDAMRDDVRSLPPIQRFACDLRSVDRFVELYRLFAKNAHWDDRASQLETVLHALWRSGDPNSIDEQSVRSLIPDEEEVSSVLFIGTAQSLIFQLEYGIDEAKSGSFEAAMKSVESSYETAYMHAQEAEDDQGLVRVIRFGSAKFESDSKRWLTEVGREVEARKADLRNPLIRRVDGSNFATLRAM